MAPTSPESRREIRVICQGEVRLQVGASGPEMVARLIDVSSKGFRACYRAACLAPGQLVRFQHRFFVGEARVVWSRTVAGEIHSGFEVVLA